MILDFAGIKLNGTEAAELTGRIGWTVADGADTVDLLLELRNGVLVYTQGAAFDDVQATARSTKTALAAALFGGTSLDDAIASGDIEISGDDAVVKRMFALLDDFPLWFPIVQP
ncbi:alkyl sulfatase C-terminal domain-containing protein [Leifsonia poae]|uniref:alkyl sulfatase C-terminal domain-containing protein n=1 Tax=Leifsonia poae TaxID=110933 RepID=UPI003D6837A5